MYPNNGASPVSLAPFAALIGVVDVVYNPWRTALMLDAEARGIPHTSGLPMLVAQAREAAELFTGRPIDPSVDEGILAALRAKMLNLILIGMPGCGKTTMGTLLSDIMDRPLLDSDEEVVRCAGMSIPELFATRGEQGFRDMESEILADMGKRSGVIIATGGGAILRDENVRALRQNGLLCLITRDIHMLPRDGRPLSSSEGAVVKLWNARREKYFAAADYVVDNGASPEDAVRLIKEGFHEAAGH